MFVLVDSDKKDGQRVCVFLGGNDKERFLHFKKELLNGSSLLIVMGSGRMFGDDER